MKTEGFEQLTVYKLAYGLAMKIGLLPIADWRKVWS